MDIDKSKLVEAAVDAQGKAYAPYSQYHVGAALLTADGDIIKGCNIENAVHSAGTCAERVAITNAISDGKRDFVAIAVATRNGGTPCGVCRQVLREFAPDIKIIIADKGEIVAEYDLDDLFPHSFGPEQVSGEA